MLAEFAESGLRLLVATLAGMAIGLNRDLKGKPTGIRTLGLVSLGSALVTIAVTRHTGLEAHPDAMSRILQGVIQGILTGVGFIGAGAILRDRDGHAVHGLTTAAAVWVTASVGIVCGLGYWSLVLAGVAVALALLVFGKRLERVFASLFGGKQADPPEEDEHSDKLSGSL